MYQEFYGEGEREVRKRFFVQNLTFLVKHSKLNFLASCNSMGKHLLTEFRII